MFAGKLKSTNTVKRHKKKEKEKERRYLFYNDFRGGF